MYSGLEPGPASAGPLEYKRQTHACAALARALSVQHWGAHLQDYLPLCRPFQLQFKKECVRPGRRG